jgi:hypothetical protein
MRKHTDRVTIGSYVVAIGGAVSFLICWGIIWIAFIAMVVR